MAGVGSCIALLQIKTKDLCVNFTYPGSSGFAVFQLQASLQAAIDALGFHSPTPVQEQVIPQALVGKDLLVSSQTGSGKTAAFLIPLLQGLLSSRNSAMRLPSGPSILVLSPTRELAQQVADDANRFTQRQSRCSCRYGCWRPALWQTTTSATGCRPCRSNTRTITRFISNKKNPT
jgi:superfamily II DNA/RNA helicase